MLEGVSRREAVPETELLSINAVTETSAARAPVTVTTERRSIKAQMGRNVRCGAVLRMSKYLKTVLNPVTVNKSIV
jgi:hypothetical protein